MSSEGTAAFERHYTVQELAALWKIDRTTVARRLLRYLDKIPDFNERRQKRFGPRKRLHRILRVPESVARKVYADLVARREV